MPLTCKKITFCFYGSNSNYNEYTDSYCLYNFSFKLFLEKLNQLFTEYDITHPTVVTQGGSFISHDVSNAASVTGKYHAQRDKRRRRSLDDTIEVSFIGESDLHPFNHSIDVRNDMDRDFDNHDALVSNFTSGLPFPTDSHAIWTNHIRRQYLHFNMSAFGRNLQLRLENKQTLIAPGAKSIFFTRDGRKIEKDLSTSCLYFGKIPQHPSSKVAISNCNGLVYKIYIVLNVKLISKCYFMLFFYAP